MLIGGGNEICGGDIMFEPLDVVIMHIAVAVYTAVMAIIVLHICSEDEE